MPGMYLLLVKGPNLALSEIYLLWLDKKIVHIMALVRELFTELFTENKSGREIESLHLSSHTGLMQVLPGHPLADPKWT